MDRTCRVCLCDQDHACVTEAGPCFWVSATIDICSACAVATAHHKITYWFPSSTTVRASCACGWTLDAPDVDGGRAELGDAICMHLRNVMQAGRANPHEHLPGAALIDELMSIDLEDEAA